ncbi:toll/interleukin-1 receptor domain-containing protein [Plantactinospora endophytica]|uniref:toll/interleukin-1 receptor domain-containing protein n=1 Tax=Plantactinospora endophytica TaxID=673535 RepID=UPI001EF231DB|nr:toll/interleukin-1 receptor domain-containing protein [Plantactinospora endophytica]
MEKSAAGIRLRVDTEPRDGSPITVGRAGAVTIATDPLDLRVSNLALTVTSVPEGWQVTPTNQNGVELYLWGLGRQRSVTGMSLVRACWIALRLVGGDDRTYWVLLDDQTASVIPAGPQGHTSRHPPTDYKKEASLDAFQLRVLRATFRDHLRWPPVLQPRARKVEAVARVLRCSPGAVRDRLDSARQKLVEVGYPQLSHIDPGFLDGFIECGLLLPSASDVHVDVLAARTEREGRSRGEAEAASAAGVPRQGVRVHQGRAILGRHVRRLPLIDGQPVRVFVSYAHASALHVEAVRHLWLLLRESGVDARLDLPATARRQDWTLWMLEQFRSADYVLVIASHEYRRRAEGEAAPDEGRGVQFEGALLRDHYYEDRETWTRKVLPVLLPGEGADALPRWLGPTSSTVYSVKELSVAGVEELLRVITDQPAYVESPLGMVPALPPQGTTSGVVGRARHSVGDQRSPVAELGALADVFDELPEFASAAGRSQIILLLPPSIRGWINEGPNARTHIIAILQGCARFGEVGRGALLDILRAVLPAEDSQVHRAITLVETSRLFEDSR